MGPCDESRFPRSRAVTGSARRGRRAADGAVSRPGTYTRKERGTKALDRASSHGTWRKPLRGDLNPTPPVKILRVFGGQTAKNSHLPPRSVSGGHIPVGAGAERHLYPLASARQSP